MDSTVGQRLGALREKSYLSRAALARKLRVSDRIVWAWEHDEYVPNGEHLRALAEVFEVSPRYIQTGEMDEQTTSIEATLAQQGEVLSRLDQRLSELWEYVRERQQPVELPTEQLEALARLERLTSELDRLLQSRPQENAQSGGASDAPPARRRPKR